jgi:hypothetical protein
MLLQISEPIWNLVTPLAFLQYPWRFLLLTFFFISLLGAGLVFLLEQFLKQKIILFFILLALSTIVIFFENRYFMPQYIYPATSEDFTSNLVINWKTSKISSEYMPINFLKPNSQQQVPLGLINPFLGKLDVLINKTQYKNLKIDSERSQELFINLAYFPFWKAYIDKKQIIIVELSKGIKVYMPKGIHNLELKFESTPIELIGNTVSVIGIILIILAIII